MRKAFNVLFFIYKVIQCNGTHQTVVIFKNCYRLGIKHYQVTYPIYKEIKYHFNSVVMSSIPSIVGDSDGQYGESQNYCLYNYYYIILVHLHV